MGELLKSYYQTYCVPRPWWITILFWAIIIFLIYLFHVYIHFFDHKSKKIQPPTFKRQWYDNAVPKEWADNWWIILLAYMILPTVGLIVLWDKGLISNSTYYPWVFFLWPLIVLMGWIFFPHLFLALTFENACGRYYIRQLGIIAFLGCMIFMLFIGGMLVCGIRML